MKLIECKKIKTNIECLEKVFDETIVNRNMGHYTEGYRQHLLYSLFGVKMKIQKLCKAKDTTNE